MKLTENTFKDESEIVELIAKKDKELKEKMLLFIQSDLSNFMRIWKLEESIFGLKKRQFSIKDHSQSNGLSEIYVLELDIREWFVVSLLFFAYQYEMMFEDFEIESSEFTPEMIADLSATENIAFYEFADFDIREVLQKKNAFESIFKNANKLKEKSQ